MANTSSSSETAVTGVYRTHTWVWRSHAYSHRLVTVFVTVPAFIEGEGQSALYFFITYVFLVLRTETAAMSEKPAVAYLMQVYHIQHRYVFGEIEGNWIPIRMRMAVTLTLSSDLLSA